MLSADLVLPIALLYVALLFAVAFVGDQRARAGRLGWLQSPVVYTLSISIYCTSWTFYGAVGSAARNGLEFATIYLGPTLVFVGWWLLLRKLVRIGQVHGTTSIADMISSRFGKSAPLAALATAIAVVGVTPYIALQLRAVTSSIEVITSAGPEDALGLTGGATGYDAAFWIAAGMALFTILFGTRNVDAKEQHHGVVAAIALEAVVKLVALLAVGVLVVWGICDGVADSFSRAAPRLLHAPDAFGSRWLAITFLSAAAVVCLPRQFQVTVVENSDERHLRTASWLFPLYLFLITLFVLPIAIAGLSLLPKGSNPDMFVLTLPMWAGQNAVALLAFLGGFSSATSMVIVACIALSTMVSNHLLMPLAMRFRWVHLNESGEVRRFLLRSRRASICALMLLGFLYFRFSGTGEALAAIGLISFAGVAQFLPSLIGGLYWRNANAAGAIAGLAAGARAVGLHAFPAQPRRRRGVLARAAARRAVRPRAAAAAGAVRPVGIRSAGAFPVLEPVGEHAAVRAGLARARAAPDRAAAGGAVRRRVPHSGRGRLRADPAQRGGRGPARARRAHPRRRRGATACSSARRASRAWSTARRSPTTTSSPSSSASWRAASARLRRAR